MTNSSPLSGSIRSCAPAAGMPIGIGVSACKRWRSTGQYRQTLVSVGPNRLKNAVSGSSAVSCCSRPVGNTSPANRICRNRGSALPARPPFSAIRPSIDGTVYQLLMCCCRNQSTNRAGAIFRASGTKQLVAPAAGAANRSNSDRSKLNGARLAIRSLLVNPKLDTHQPENAVIALNGITTPLGWPLEPEVYRIAARSSSFNSGGVKPAPIPSGRSPIARASMSPSPIPTGPAPATSSKRQPASCIMP